jgi:hypothetical protein
MKIDRHQPLHNNRVAADGLEISVLIQRFLSAAEHER